MRPPTYDAHETGRMLALHGAPLASFQRRAVALFIDFVLAGALWMLIVYPAALLLYRAGVIVPETEVTLRLNFFRNWYSVVWLALYYSAATYIGNGKTPGKWLTRIRVVSLVHERMGLWHSLERALGYGASMLEGGFGFVQYFLHPNRRTVHDRIAETIVVAEPKRPHRTSPSEPAARLRSHG